MRRFLRFTLRVAGIGLLALIILAAVGLWYFHPSAEVVRGVVYTERHGEKLTLDVMRPGNANGIGVLVVVSGSWRSRPNKFRSWIAAPLLRQGHTVFAVTHLSQPRASIPETVEDMHRAVRFVRYHARDYGVDPARLAVTGASSGGHLSLMLATRGGPGAADARDPVDREDSSVGAVAVFFPVTDLLNLGTSTENDGTGGPPRNYKRAFGPDGGDLAQWPRIGKEVSPIFHIPEHLPPVIIAHGDADTLVPIDQSQRFIQAARARGHEIRLLVRPGKPHGWLTMPWDLRTFARWLQDRLS